MDEIVQARYRSYEWDKPFDPNEYRSPKAITLLYENYLQAASSLVEFQARVEELRKRVSELDKSKALLEQEVKTLQKGKWIPFVLQLMSAISGGVGVNILTGRKVLVYGWLFIAMFIALEIIAFVILKSEKKR